MTCSAVDQQLSKKNFFSGSLHDCHFRIVIFTLLLSFSLVIFIYCHFHWLSFLRICHFHSPLVIFDNIFSYQNNRSKSCWKRLDLDTGYIEIHRKMRIKKFTSKDENKKIAESEWTWVTFNSQLIKYRFILLWCYTKIIQRPPTDEAMEGGHIKANDNGSMTTAPCVYRWSLGDFYVTTSNYIRHKEIKYCNFN
jgi:hypothetical protein